jgi:2,4-dienoyl-CoA reductase-like NADH-dependent reductase (Old Yellow Enzyme family)
VDLVGGASESHNSPRAGIKSVRADLVLLAREFLRELYWPRLAVRALGHKDAVAGPVQYGRA